MKRWFARTATSAILSRWVKPCSLWRRVVIEWKQLAVRWRYQPKSYERQAEQAILEYAQRQERKQ